MGPAQKAMQERNQPHKLLPVASNGYGPATADGSPTLAAPDTAAYFRATSPKGPGSVVWAIQNPEAAGMGYKQVANDPDGSLSVQAERALVRYGRLRPRGVDWKVPEEAPGLGGPYQGLGYQPKEAVPTARHTIVARQAAQVSGGNTHAFMPPPDKFLVLNLRKQAPVTRTAATTRAAPSLAGTRAPRGNG